MPKPDLRADVLLDTHVLIWWQAGSDLLSRQALSRIEHADRLLISPISFWELSMLVRKERIGLDRATSAWVRDFLATDRVEVADLSPAVAVAAGELSNFHGDPADRLIVATARVAGATVITKDHKILAYAASSGLIAAQW